MYRDHSGWVEAMIQAGEPFQRVEREIDASMLGDEHRDALWLVAWCLDRRRGGSGEVPSLEAAEERRPRLRSVR